jgi:hypothetical protein
VIEVFVITAEGTHLYRASKKDCDVCDLKAALAEASTNEYETSVFSDDLANAKARAEQVIKDNLVPKGEAGEPACPASE